MAKMKRRRVAVHIGDLDNPETHEVTLINADHLRAELEGKKYGVSTEEPMHYLTLCAWSAMLREGHYEKAFPDFRTDCLQVDRIDTEENATEVPPTERAASDVSP